MNAKQALSVYNGVHDKKGVVSTLNSVVKRIRTGERGLAERCDLLRKLYLTDKDAYDREKEKLPAVAFSGIFLRRKADALKIHSGLVTIDIDDLPLDDIPYLLSQLAQMPEVLLAFVSPSGAGIKAIVRVDPIPNNDLEHKGAYQACLEFFDDLATEYDFEIDTSGKDCSRLCFLAHDPLLILHTDAPFIDWDREAWLTAEKEKQDRFAADAKIAYTGDVDITALDHIDPNDLDYNQWLSVLTACKIAGLSWQQADAWSQRGGVRYSAGEVENRWHGLNLDVSWGAVVNLAKLNGFKPKRPTRQDQIQSVRSGDLSPLALYRKPVKLVSEHVHAVLDTLAKAQDRIAEFFRSSAKVLAFRADTGTGKNYESETYAINEGAILVNVPIGDLAIDLELRMLDRLIEANLPSDYVFRRRGLMHRWSDGYEAHLRFPHEVPCIQADRADAYRRKGGNMYTTICPYCPSHVECLESGYLSQPERAKEALMVITSHPDFHINPKNKGFVKSYLTDCTGDKRLIVQDDVSVHALFLEYEITKDRLQQWRDDWDGAFLSSFAKKLLTLLESEGTPYAIGEYLDTLTEKQKALLSYQMTHVRLQTTGPDGTDTYFVMGIDEAVAKGFFSLGGAGDIELELPAVYPKGWTLIDQLSVFFQYYRREADAPIEYRDDTLTFMLPPRLHDKVWKAIFMSATLDLDLFKRAFPNADTQQTPPTAFAQGAKVYQLRTNRNPRKTVFRFENGEPVGLSQSGESYWQLMIHEIARTPDTKHAIITYKPVFEWKAAEEASDLTELDNIVATAHYGNLVGLDTEFQDADVLWILFAPEIPHGDQIPDNEITWRAKMFFGNDGEPLDYEYDTEAGKYRDPRVQKVWENAVIGELIQAIGRARLVRKARKVVILTSHRIEGITDRAETRLFDEADWEIAGSLDNLDDAIDKRERAESRIEALTAENTIAEFQEVYGCSYERARQLWHAAGGKDAANTKDIEIAERAKSLKSQGLSLRKIATEMDISKSKVDRILKGK